MAQSEPKQYPNVFIIDNGWVEYLKKESKVKKHCDPNQKSYHGDATVKIILESHIPEENIYLINVYENSYITGEPKVEKQASLRRVLQLANGGDVMLMNMELYREPYNLPITSDPASLEIVNELAKKGVFCIFPTGNSCIDLSDKIEPPKNYILVGSTMDESKIYTSNFVSDKYDKVVDKKINIKYQNLADCCSGNFGLTQSSAAAALVIKDLLNEHRGELNLIKESIDEDKTKAVAIFISKHFKGSKNPNKEDVIKTTNIKYKFDITDYMLNKWRKELTVDHSGAISLLANHLNPINRNLFPYPTKLKVYNRKGDHIDNDKVLFTRKIKINKLKELVERFKDGKVEGKKENIQTYLALKLCFGIDANGDILVIGSGYIPFDFTNEATKKESETEKKGKKKKEEKSFFAVSGDSYYLNYEKEPDAISIPLVDKKIPPAKRSYYISEFQRYFKKTDTYGLTIGLNVLDALLMKYYEGDDLQIMIVSDSREIKSEQEFGILIVDENGNKPICIIKDRVINQADGPTCPPVPPCEE